MFMLSIGNLTEEAKKEEGGNRDAQEEKKAEETPEKQEGSTLPRPGVLNLSGPRLILRSPTKLLLNYFFAIT